MYDDYKVKVTLPKKSKIMTIEKYDTIWDKVSADIEKNDSKPIYNQKSFKTKVNSHGDEATDLHNK